MDEDDIPESLATLIWYWFWDDVRYDVEIAKENARYEFALLQKQYDDMLAHIKVEEESYRQLKRQCDADLQSLLGRMERKKETMTEEELRRWLRTRSIRERDELKLNRRRCEMKARNLESSHICLARLNQDRMDFMTHFDYLKMAQTMEQVNETRKRMRGLDLTKTSIAIKTELKKAMARFNIPTRVAVKNEGIAQLQELFLSEQNDNQVNDSEDDLVKFLMEEMKKKEEEPATMSKRRVMKEAT